MLIYLWRRIVCYFLEHEWEWTEKGDAFYCERCGIVENFHHYQR